jgi:LPXTG-site transpeptidase (sortase) family protein
MARFRFTRAERAGFIGAGLLILIGIGCVGVAVSWQFWKLQAERDWLASAEARRAARAVAEPTPIWLGDSSIAASNDGAAVGATQVVPLATAVNASDGAVRPAPPRRGVDVVDLLDATFVFLDPPQPGARARLSISIRNRGAQPIDVAVSIATDWFENYRLLKTLPESTTDPEPADGMRRLTFVPQPRGDQTLELEFAATSDSVEAPVAQIALTSGEALGEAHPRTMAPRPRPGPISALRIPSLRISAAVVPTTWDPPAFVIGEVRGSADVGLGNSVLVGHLTGAAGAIFKDLHQLQPGDPIIATSRGIEYTFEVSDVQTRPAADSALTAASAQPRLTLMTCTGTWDPIGRNFSDRLWIIAEPPDQAAQTIAENAARPPTPTPVSPEPTPTADIGSSQSSAAPVGETQMLVSSGLGAERAALDRRWGPPLGETAGKLVVYRQGAAEFHVAFTPEPQRARLISVQSLGPGATLDLPKAVERARAEFPEDTAPRIPAPEDVLGMVVERMTSPALAAALGYAGPGGSAGDFVVVYQRDRAGSINRVVVGAGNDVAAIASAAAL